MNPNTDPAAGAAPLQAAAKGMRGNQILLLHFVMVASEEAPAGAEVLCICFGWLRARKRCLEGVTGAQALRPSGCPEEEEDTMSQHLMCPISGRAGEPVKMRESKWVVVTRVGQWSWPGL